MAPTLYLVKDSNDLVSHCACETALISYPAQQSCPWCGCGWLFTCVNCRKAFTFARAVELPQSLREIAELDALKYWGEVSEEMVADWLDLMPQMLERVELGKRYIYFDGRYISVDEFPVEIHGWHGQHDFDEAPQITALRDPSIIPDLLQNVEYWTSHAYQEKTKKKKKKK